MIRPAFLLAAVPALLSGCVSFRTVDDGVVRARIAETAMAGTIVVVPTGVLEDSRCPASVQCVSAGRVRITAMLDGDTAEMTLGQPVQLAAGSLTLAEVYPERREGVALYPDEYRFGFRWQAVK